jgi:hypothetical protein
MTAVYRVRHQLNVIIRWLAISPRKFERVALSTIYCGSI